MSVKITRELYEDAQGDSVSWPMSPPEGIGFTEHKISFLDILILAGGNLPYLQPAEVLRLAAVWFVAASPEVSNIIEALPMFKPSAAMSLDGYVGQLYRWEIYRVTDPKIIPSKHFVVGHGPHACRGQVTGEP